MDHSMHNHHHMMETTTTAMNHHNHHHNGNMSMMMNTSAGTPHGGMNHSGMDHSGMDHSGMDHSGMDHSGHTGDMMGHMMKMYFHTGSTEYVLFESCKTTTQRDMIVACVVIFFVAIMYEGLKFVREVLLQNSLRDRAQMYYPDNKMPSSNANSQEQMVVRGANASGMSQMLSSCHAVQTVLHVIQIFVSYCLMLVFMTYNVWLCLSVVLGAGFGYFIFGWKRAVVVDSNEHCH